MWEKICVKTLLSEGVEKISAVLINNGITGMEIVDSAERVRDLKSVTGTWDYADESLLKNDGKTFVYFYVAKEEGYEKLIGKIESELKRVVEVEIERERFDESEWADEWKKHFKPIKIGDVVIVPEWEEFETCPQDIIFRIDPGVAFGTGQHESTRL